MFKADNGAVIYFNKILDLMFGSCFVCVFGCVAVADQLWRLIAPDPHKHVRLYLLH